MKRLPLKSHLIAAAAIVTIFLAGLATPSLAKSSKYQNGAQGHYSGGRGDGGGAGRRSGRAHRGQPRRGHGKRWTQPRRHRKPEPRYWYPGYKGDGYRGHGYRGRGYKGHGYRWKGRYRYGYRRPYYGYSHYYHDYDAFKWIAFAVITLGVLDLINENQRRAHESAQIRATEAPVGYPVKWSQGNAHGEVVTLREGRGVRSGRYCREFQQTIVVGGRQERAHGTACQQPDGSWQMLPAN